MESQINYETFIFTANHYQTLIDEGEETKSYDKWLLKYLKETILSY